MPGPVPRALLLAASMLAGTAPARAAGDITGEWQGRYFCGQGATALTLTVRPAGGTQVRALFHFYAAKANPAVPEGCFEMNGSFDPATSKVSLTAGSWLQQPPDYVTVDLAGRVAPGGTRMTGQVLGPQCTSFELQRVSARPGAAAASCRRAGLTAALR